MVLDVLKNEPAYVRKVEKRCFDQGEEKVYKYFFELKNKNKLPDHVMKFVYPLNIIPEPYRKEGLSVYISGNIINCETIWGCIPPNARIAPNNLFEIKSITIKN